jgi:hypothetical protein
LPEGVYRLSQVRHAARSILLVKISGRARVSAHPGVTEAFDREIPPRCPAVPGDDCERFEL